MLFPLKWYCNIKLLSEFLLIYFRIKSNKKKYMLAIKQLFPIKQLFKVMTLASDSVEMNKPKLGLKTLKTQQYEWHDYSK